MNNKPVASRKVRGRRLLTAAVTASALAGTTASAAPADPAPPAGNQAGASGSATELVLRALGLLGVNYGWGGNTPDDGLDCSGLVRHVFREAAGLVLPRRSEEMSQTGQQVRLDQLKPGDLVFFNTVKRAFSHVGIYIGNNQFVHAPSQGGSVRVETLTAGYWAKRFDGARRFLHGEREGQIDAGALDKLLGALMPDNPSDLPVAAAPGQREDQRRR